MFVMFFTLSEVMGLYSLTLFANGFILMGCIIYISKLLPVVIAFSILDKATDKLYTFKWFEVTHKFIINTIQRLKESEMYLNIRAVIKPFKEESNNKFKQLFLYSVSKYKNT